MKARPAAARLVRTVDIAAPMLAAPILPFIAFSKDAFPNRRLTMSGRPYHTPDETMSGFAT
jgi:hypothetical protein